MAKFKAPTSIKDLTKKTFKNKISLNTLRQDLRGASTHGIAYILDTRLQPFERLFWAFSFITCCVFIFVLLMPLYTRFVESPLVTSVERDYFAWNVSFPALTFCPRRTDDAALEHLTQKYLNKTGEDLRALFKCIATVNLYSLNEACLKIEEHLTVLPPSSYAAAAAALLPPAAPALATSGAELRAAAVATERGTCHSVNSNVAVFDDPNNWGNAHVKYEKSNVEVSLYEGDFYTQMTNYDDVYKVFIHGPDEVIQRTTTSHSHQETGFMFLGVTVRSTRISDDLRRMPISFRKCRLTSEPVSARYPVYSFQHCMLECRIWTILRVCGCVPHFYRPLAPEKTCSLQELSCVLRHKKEIITLARKPSEHKGSSRPSARCGCLPACESDVYQKEFENYNAVVSINRLRIGLSRFPKVRVVREIIFSFYDVVLKTGGVVNLCIGSSIISLVEVILVVFKFVIIRLQSLPLRLR